MGGYVTETRRIPGFEANRPQSRWWAWRNQETSLTREGDEFGTEGANLWGIPTQTTTSFRDRGRELEGAEVSSGLTWAARTKELASSDLSRRASRHDNGHTFHTVKNTLTSSRYSLYDGEGRLRYRGRIVPDSTSNISSTGIRWGISEHFPVSQATLEARGTEAIAATWPTNPPAALAEALIETYREGLPALIGLNSFRQRFRPTAIASEHLNYQFGWRPLVNDLKRAARAAAMSSEILARYQEESGRKLHRSRDFPETKYQEIIKSTNHGLSVPNQSGALFWFSGQGVGNLTQTISHSQRMWFRGAFSYYLQTDNLTVNKLHEIADHARHVYGIEFTPDVLWQVSPWTWLIDWVGNIGINITNATRLSQDGMILRYGYMMRHTVASRRRECVRSLRFQSGSIPLSVVHTRERKERIRATPFGFGLNPDTFSGRQWSILAALGMTRGDRALRLSD